MRLLFLVNLLETYSASKYDVYGVTFIFLIYKYFKDTKEITSFQKLVFLHFVFFKLLQL